MNRGFTLIELVISIGIFVIMSTVVVAKFGTFNTSTLLTDTAYDIALAIRQAQTYGLSVKNVAQGSQNFLLPYGMAFTAGSFSCSPSETVNNTTMVLYADVDSSGTCNIADTAISRYAIRRGGTVSSVCVGTGNACDQTVNRLSISFQRPNPEALICGVTLGVPTCNQGYGEITITGTDGATRKVGVLQNGQITVQR